MSIYVDIFVLFYALMHCAFFGLLLGLAAEDAKNWKHRAFLWLLAVAWPLIIALKFLCRTGAKA